MFFNTIMDALDMFNGLGDIAREVLEVAVEMLDMFKGDDMAT
jgi:hypothetical protein